jgi:hypothetical protein
MSNNNLKGVPSVGKSAKGGKLISSTLLNSVKQLKVKPIPIITPEEDVPVLKIRLTVQNILTLFLIILLTIIGTVYIWILSTKKRCTCRLCKKEYDLNECIGEGGFGAIFLVTRTQQKGVVGKYILKKLEMKDLNELEKV